MLHPEIPGGGPDTREEEHLTGTGLALLEDETACAPSIVRKDMNKNVRKDMNKNMDDARPLWQGPFRQQHGRMMPDTTDPDSPIRTAGPTLSNGCQRMATMKDETVTPFRRDERFLPQDDALPALSRQHVAALHQLYDPILNEPVPPRMLELLRRYKG